MTTEEIELADRRLVRLRRLFDYQLPRRGSEAPTRGRGAQPSNHKSSNRRSFEVRELRFDGIDVALRWSGGDRVELPSGGALLLGAPNRPAVAELGIRGALRYAPTEASAGGLDVTADRLRLAMEGVVVGSRRLDVGRLRSDEVRAHLGFAGLKPASLDAKLLGLRLRDLDLRQRP